MVRGGMRTGLGLTSPRTAAASDTLWQRLLLAIGDSEPAGTVTAPQPARPTLPREVLDEFEPFFRAHERDIFTYLWRMTGDEQAAYDLAQETFLRAWQHFARIHGYEHPGGWLFRVATHLALNHLRSRATFLGAAASLDGAGVAHHALPPSNATSDPGARIADADAVRRVLSAISPRQRAALVLREVYGLSCAEVAAALGISAGAAKTLLWRARDEFRSRYAEEAR
jgi:RNA polymerase sigma-70 factor, ECF subfamily